MVWCLEFGLHKHRTYQAPGASLSMSLVTSYRNPFHCSDTSPWNLSPPIATRLTLARVIEFTTSCIFRFYL